MAFPDTDLGNNGNRVTEGRVDCYPVTDVTEVYSGGRLLLPGPPSVASLPVGRARELDEQSRRVTVQLRPFDTAGICRVMMGTGLRLSRVLRWLSQRELEVVLRGPAEAGAGK